MPLNIRGKFAGVLLAAALLLAGCHAPQDEAAEPPTLASLQRAAYEAIAAGDGAGGLPKVAGGAGLAVLQHPAAQTHHLGGIQLAALLQNQIGQCCGRR